MSDLPTARITVKRSALDQPPESLSFGELAWADGGEGALFIGRRDGSIQEIPTKEAGEPGSKGEPGPSIIHVGPTPPTAPEKLLWIQVNDVGGILQRWQRHDSESWLSQETWHVQAVGVQVNGNRLYTQPNPCPGELIWIESLTARGRSQDKFRGTVWQAKLSTVSELAQEIPQHFLEVSGLEKSQAFNVSESVGLLVPWQEALTIWLRFKRSGGSAKLKFCSIGAVLRRVYDAT